MFSERIPGIVCFQEIPITDGRCVSQPTRSIMTRVPASRRQRLTEAWALLQFAWHTLIAPWPPFALFLVVIGVVGGLMPLGRITAISHLIDRLTVQAGGPSS